ILKSKTTSMAAAAVGDIIFRDVKNTSMKERGTADWRLSFSNIERPRLFCKAQTSHGSCAKMLIDPHSYSYEAITYIFSPIEQKHWINIFIEYSSSKSTRGDKIVIILPRYKMQFSIEFGRPK